MENMSDKIIKTIQSMIGKYGVYNIFEDWVRMLKNGWFIDQNGKAYKVYADNDGGLWYYSENGTVVILK